MPLNVSPEGTKSGRDDEPRRALTEQLLAELTAWSPRDRAAAFKRWHMGSLSVVHLSLLSTLEARGAQAMGVLAEELDVSVASATGIVDRMEKRGLVRRGHDADDRRVVLVHPTEQGLDLVRMVGDHRRARLTMALQRLDATQLTTMVTVLRTIRAAIVEDTAAEAAEVGADVARAGAAEAAGAVDERAGR